MSDKKINLIIVGGFSYPKGMADTKRIQHLIKALSNHKQIDIKVLVLRQNAGLGNNKTGIQENIPYKTLFFNYTTKLFALLLPVFYLKCIFFTLSNLKFNKRNVFLIYGTLDLENIAVCLTAKCFGSRLIFDIVEDINVAYHIEKSINHKTKIFIYNTFEKFVVKLSSAIIVISNRLVNKYSTACQEFNKPLVIRPISVDFSNFNYTLPINSTQISLFYSGSFGQKDGVEYLIESFNILAQKYTNLVLVLTGMPIVSKINDINNLINSSPYTNRIHLLGYLNDEKYYEELLYCSIPCMVRINTEYANAGFPFKLGEYLASGKPCIVTDVSDINKYLIHKENAIIVESGSVQDIVKGIEYIIDNPLKAKEIGDNAKAAAIKYFDLMQQGNNFVDLLKSIK